MNTCSGGGVLLKRADLRGQTALVTGASSGIGLELAKLLARDGCNLVLASRNAGKLNEISSGLQQTGIDVQVIAEDLADPSAPDRLADTLARSDLRVDVLVNNAGIGAHGALAELDPDRQLKMIQLNVVALTHLSRLLLPAMIGRGHGAVLNVASTAGFLPGPYMTVYYATKAYVLSFTEALAEELQDTGVTATCLAPGPTRTAFRAAAGMQKTELLRFGAMDAADVAHCGYAAMLKGKVLAVPGLINRIALAGLRLTPRPIARRLVRRLNGG